MIKLPPQAAAVKHLPPLDDGHGTVKLEPVLSNLGHTVQQGRVAGRKLPASECRLLHMLLQCCWCCHEMNKYAVLCSTR
jgi:hypothetical protein